MSEVPLYGREQFPHLFATKRMELRQAHTRLSRRTEKKLLRGLYGKEDVQSAERTARPSKPYKPF